MRGEAPGKNPRQTGGVKREVVESRAGMSEGDVQDISHQRGNHPADVGVEAGEWKAEAGKEFRDGGTEKKGERQRR